MKKNIIKIRIFLWMLLVIIIFALFYFAIIPTGYISYSTDFCKSSEFISKFSPIERLGESELCVQKIIGDPVYFSLRTPRTFDKAEIKIKYRTSENYLGAVEMGNLVDNIVWRYDLRPIENEAINKLSLVWDVIQEEETMLLQRDKKYNSVQEFLDEIEKQDGEINIDELLLYNYDLQKEFILKDYEARKLSFGYPKLSFDGISLRGSYQFYTYIKDEDMDFNFSIKDLNENKDKDSVEIIIFYEDLVIESIELEDDGVVSDDGEISEERIVNLKSVNLPEGAYKIEVKANDDIVTTGIETKQRKVSFINKVWLYNDDMENINIYTDSDYVQFNTINPEGLQKIIIDNNEIEIEETYNQYAVDTWSSTTTSLTRIVLEKDGIIVSGNGLFSLDEENYFNPVIKKFDSSIDINEENINFVLANYKIPETKGEWKVATQEFNLKDSYREFYKYGFIVSVPGLDSEDGVQDWVEISEVKVDLVGRSLLEKIKEVFGVSF